MTARKDEHFYYTQRIGIWFVPLEKRTFELLTDPFSFILSEGKTKQL